MHQVPSSHIAPSTKAVQPKQWSAFSSIPKVSLAASLCWTILLTGLLFWNVQGEKRQTFEVATYQARSFFQDIQATRNWNSSHGGVYVPITEQTPTNPYLDVPDRDVKTLDGLRLTKINPAYMTRQIGEIMASGNAVWFHLTSDKPIRPANKPLPWEKKVLESFQTGVTEYSEFVDLDDGRRIFRYMAPLWVEQPCLDCHAKQGYKKGDLRGGISVSINAGPIVSAENRQIRNVAIAYGIIWGLGLLVIGKGMSRLRREEKEREKVILMLQETLGKVKTLRGLIPICAACKKIRDDKGYWQQLESYISEHSNAEFTHGICRECADRLYPEIELDKPPEE